MPEEMTRLVKARDEYDYYEGHLDSKAEHTAYLTGELIDDFAIAGPVDRCLEKIAALADAGSRGGLDRVPERPAGADAAGRARDRARPGPPTGVACLDGVRPEPHPEEGA